MTLLDGLLNALCGIECVCTTCVRPGDVVVGPSGDFSVCGRCRESITSKTGKTIRKVVRR
jgi:hypothetical protein